MTAGARRSSRREFLYGTEGFKFPLRTKVSGRIWTPAAITTSAWYDASVESTITVSDGFVAEWRDVKGSTSVSLTQSSGSNKPILTANRQASKPALDFNGASSFLQNANGATLVSSQGNFQYRVVFKANAAAGTSTGGDTGLNNNLVSCNANGGALPNIYFRSGNLIGTTSYNYGWFNPEMSFTTGEWAIAGARHTSSTTISLNGAYGPVGNGNYGYSNGFNLGRSTRATAGSYFNGSVAELVYVPGAVSEDIAYRLDGYLAHKWGIQDKLPTGHPYKSAAPML